MPALGFKQTNGKNKYNALVLKSYSEAEVPHAPFNQSIYDKRLNVVSVIFC